MARVFVSIGSNVDPDHNVRSCISMLRRRFGRLQLSSVYRTAPVGFDGDDFYNLVAAFDTDEDAHGVAKALRGIEDRHGRVRDEAKWGPRTLDLDLLLYDDLVLDEAPLAIPRTEITEYAFVLGPLAELAGNQRHPVLGMTFSELWRSFDDGGHRLAPVDLSL
jgi:2-amino-4-hydroxy-6-hydroxymethyldihydropteridine diphosphokinase